MRILDFTQGIPDYVQADILQLACAHAADFVGCAIGADSPLFPLAVAEVFELLGDSLSSINRPELLTIAGVDYLSTTGVLVAVDEAANEGRGRFAGFLQYKSRIPACDSASIGYSAVVDEYRNRGVLKLMLEQLRTKHPALGLDCSLELVPMYEHLGFHVSGQQGVHVAMCTTPLSGMSWMRDQEYLDSTKSMLAAKAKVRDLLGKETRNAYARRDADTATLTSKVKAFVKERMASQSNATYATST